MTKLARKILRAAAASNEVVWVRLPWSGGPVKVGDAVFDESEAPDAVFELALGRYVETMHTRSSEGAGFKLTMKGREEGRQDQ